MLKSPLMRLLYFFIFFCLGVIFVSELRGAIGCAECEGKFYIRSRAAVNEFKKKTGYEKGRPGYVIDHIVPLACGKEIGIPEKELDMVWNMNWQTVEEGREKDKWERKNCWNLWDNPKFTPTPQKKADPQKKGGASMHFLFLLL